MNWQDYKRICERPHYFSRWAIELTAELAGDEQVTVAMAAVLSGPVLTKPGGHTGDARTDHFGVSIPIDIANLAVSKLYDVSESLSDEPSRRVRHLAIVWQEYIRAQTASGAVSVESVEMDVESL